MAKESLKVTVITVCYNAVDSILATVESVISQTYENLEYIIIDGGSSDGTLSVIRPFLGQITKVISEPDGGIYDAMNKGIRHSTGDFLIFMNSGDCFYNKDVVQNCLGRIDSLAVDLIYGDCFYKESNSLRYVKSLPLQEIKRQMVFSHQSVFFSAHVIKEIMYDVRYKLAADYKLVLQCYVENKRFKYVPEPISKVIKDQGVTHDRFWLSKKETYKIQTELGVPLGDRLSSFIYYYVKGCVYGLAKQILPPFIIANLRKRRDK